MENVTYLLREIVSSDNLQIKKIILEVSTEYGTYDPNLNQVAGSGAGDSELEDLFNAYNESGAKYWIVEDALTKKILGGGGYKKLKGASIAEMQKLFLLPEARGQGLAKQIIQMILKSSKEDGYRQIYLESASQMKEAIKLYERFGFNHLEKALGNTGHFQCGVFTIKDLGS